MFESCLSKQVISWYTYSNIYKNVNSSSLHYMYMWGQSYTYLLLNLIFQHVMIISSQKHTHPDITSVMHILNSISSLTNHLSTCAMIYFTNNYANVSKNPIKIRFMQYLN